MEAGFTGKMAGSKSVQVKGVMLPLAAKPQKTPLGKAVRKKCLNTFDVREPVFDAGFLEFEWILADLVNNGNGR